MLGEYKYKAFISYSHQDKDWANWLHKRLETYPIPKRLVGQTNKKGEIPRRLSPIFRDREELEAAGSLSDKIEQGLQSSQNMIVLCSPRSAKSHWVQQEILRFKKLHPKGDIYPAIIDGEPFASNMPGREDEECFPEALRFEFDAKGELTDTPAEPLGADLRKTGDGKRMGSLKLVSGLVGVGLDEIVQRDMQRGRKRVMAVTGGSLAGMLVMATLTVFAISAREEADARRNDAEGLIEFMLTDLREKLEPVGRLDALEAVGDRAVEYYDKQSLKDMEDDALGRRARVFNYLGEFDEKLGKMDVAVQRWQSSYETTKTLLARNPNDPQRIYDHAQSAFWVGYGHYYGTQDYETTEQYYSEYKMLSDRLVEIDPDNLDWQMEKAWGFSNLASVYIETSEPLKALKYAQESVDLFELILDKRPNDKTTQVALVKDGYHFLLQAQSRIAPISRNIETIRKQLDISENLTSQYPYDVINQTRTINILLEYGIQHYFRGEPEKAIQIIEPAVKQSLTLTKVDETNIEVKRSHFHAAMTLTRTYLNSGRLTDARKQIDKQSLLIGEIKQKAENEELYYANFEASYDYVKARLHMSGEEFALAEQRVDNILKTTPASLKAKSYSFESFYFRALIIKGKILDLRGRHTEAQQYWQKAYTFAHSHDSLKRVGNRLYFLETVSLLGLMEEQRKAINRLKELGVSQRLINERI